MNIRLLLCLFMICYSCKQGAPVSEEVLQDNDDSYVANANTIQVVNIVPSGMQPGTTTNIDLQITSNFASNCRYDTHDINFLNMTYILNTSDDVHHNRTINVSTGNQYKYYVVCQDNSTGTLSESKIIDFEVDSNIVDTAYPNITSSGPSNMLADGTTQITIYATTNENTNCRFSDNNNDEYPQMTDMDNTGGTTHGQLISDLSDGSSYNYYIQCQDPSNNLTSKSSIQFTVDVFVLKDGLTLYMSHCSGCHNSIEYTDISNATPEFIRFKINNVGQMRSLSSLKDAEVQAISDVVTD